MLKELFWKHWLALEARFFFLGGGRGVHTLNRACLGNIQEKEQRILVLNMVRHFEKKILLFSSMICTKYLFRKKQNVFLNTHGSSVDVVISPTIRVRLKYQAFLGGPL